MLPATHQRVPMHTCEDVNHRIRQSMHRRVAQYRTASAHEIDRRLAQLDHEWDIERVLEANAATVSMLGVVAGATWHRRWFYLPAVVGGFLLQHALQGWCPPLPVFRRLGYRTAREIDEERYALKTLRGDFDQRTIEAGEDRVAAALRAAAD